MIRTKITFLVMLALLGGVASTVVSSAAISGEADYVIQGQVRQPNGSPLPGLAVVVIEKTSGGEKRLGQTTTDAAGRYSVRYAQSPRSKLAVTAGKQAPTGLLVRAVDRSGKVLAQSEKITDPKPTQLVDLRLRPVETSYPR